jgi:hypothetical protein
LVNPHVARSLLAAVSAIVLKPVRGRGDDFLDHRVAKDTGGVYSLQDAVPVSLGLLAAGCAIWQGSEDGRGKTCWESAESGLGAVIAAEGLQLITGRRPPSATSDPNHWFAGGAGRSAEWVAQVRGARKSEAPGFIDRLGDTDTRP